MSFMSAARTFLLSARSPCLELVEAPLPGVAVEDAAGALPGSPGCDHALMDVVTINAPTASLSMLITFIAFSSLLDSCGIPVGIAVLLPRGEPARFTGQRSSLRAQ
ncbi:hypothetical protein [Paraburkholderia sp. UCT70]|uniref:hypothetical protein n=1 Tax=Paraburkholderia sp. UCT70 TaxID=2991068 RepID=UPI003D25EBB1